MVMELDSDLVDVGVRDDDRDLELVTDSLDEGERVLVRDDDAASHNVAQRSTVASASAIAAAKGV